MFWFKRLGRLSHPAATRIFTSMSAAQTKTVKIGLCQVLVGADKQKNLETASAAVREAKKKGADLIMLPEMFNCPYSNDSFPGYAEEVPFDIAGEAVKFNGDAKEHPSLHAISNMAKENGVWLIAGSIPERHDSNLYNTSLVCNPEGLFVAKHRKVHLFDIDVPGKMTFKESDTLTPGSSFTSFESPFGKIGVGICYDLRFPEYAMLLAKAGCSILCYPGAFNMTTGPAHWELLQRGRAVDNQLYVATCSPARNPESAYQAWGHSTIVGPWGDIVATTEHEPDVVVAEVDLQRVDEVRTSIPVRKQKRLDMYEVVSNRKA